MIRKLVRLSDGTEIFSGPGSATNIRSCTVTQCVNAGEELTIGSVCAACVEMLVQAPDNTFRPESAFTLYDVDDVGVETKIGLFNVKTAHKKGESLFRVTAYDNVMKLDKDLTDWLEDNAGQLTDPRDFIRGVCDQCNVTLNEVPNYGDFHTIVSFSARGKVTGRQLLQWVAEMLCYFVVADEDGEICFRWYRDNTSVILGSAGQRYRIKGSYKHNNGILPVDGVRMRLRDSEGNVQKECQYPFYETFSNPYIIESNPILIAKDMNNLFEIAEDIIYKLNADRDIFSSGGTDHLAACEVMTPASQDVRVGDIIIVCEQDPGNANTTKIYMRVMTKIQKGQMDTLKCTGSYRRRN